MASFFDKLFNRKPKPDFGNVESRTTTQGGSGSGSGGAIKPDFSRVDNTQQAAPGADFRGVGSSVSSTERARSPGVSGYGGSGGVGSTGAGTGSRGAGQPAAKTYTVVSGDTLSEIAQRHYGSASRWPQIFEANRDKLSDPDKIFPGQVLRIPADDGRG